MAIATESGHWYTRNGIPAYTYTNKKGQEKNTTLREARKMDLVPSVTTIMNLKAKPGLERWKLNNMLMSALTLPQNEGESLDDYSKRIIQDAQEQSSNAAQEGTNIHAAIEQCFNGVPYDLQYDPHVRAVLEFLKQNFPHTDWEAEKSFAHLDGYGGKLDLFSRERPIEDPRPIVIDFKTKEFGPDDKRLGWPEQVNQLAAYRMGLNLRDARLVNIFISTSNPGLVRMKEWTEEEAQKGERVFKLLLELWKLEKNYDPSFCPF